MHAHIPSSLAKTKPEETAAGTNNIEKAWTTTIMLLMMGSQVWPLQQLVIKSKNLQDRSSNADFD
jgi:hypothetical protein